MSGRRIAGRTARRTPLGARGTARGTPRRTARETAILAEPRRAGEQMFFYDPYYSEKSVLFYGDDIWGYAQDIFNINGSPGKGYKVDENESIKKGGIVLSNKYRADAKWLFDEVNSGRLEPLAVEVNDENVKFETNYQGLGKSFAVYGPATWQFGATLLEKGGYPRGTIVLYGGEDEFGRPVFDKTETPGWTFVNSHLEEIFDLFDRESGETLTVPYELSGEIPPSVQEEEEAFGFKKVDVDSNTMAINGEYSWFFAPDFFGLEGEPNSQVPEIGIGWLLDPNQLSQVRKLKEDIIAGRVKPAKLTEPPFDDKFTTEHILYYGEGAWPYATWLLSNQGEITYDDQLGQWGFYIPKTDQAAFDKYVKGLTIPEALIDLERKPAGAPAIPEPPEGYQNVIYRNIPLPRVGDLVSLSTGGEVYEGYVVEEILQTNPTDKFTIMPPDAPEGTKPIQVDLVSGVFRAVQDYPDSEITFQS